MTEVTQDIPNPITKAIAANQEAESALTPVGDAQPNVELANAWAAIAANWASMIDPRSSEVRRILKPRPA